MQSRNADGVLLKANTQQELNVRKCDRWFDHDSTFAFWPRSSISEGTALRVLKRTSVPGCWRKMGAVSTVVRVSCRSCLMFLPGRPLEGWGGGVPGILGGNVLVMLVEVSRSLCTFRGIAGTSGIWSRPSSEYTVEVDVRRNCSLSFCSSMRLDCWLTHESTVRKRGTDDRVVM